MVRVASIGTGQEPRPPRGNEVIHRETSCKNDDTLSADLRSFSLSHTLTGTFNLCFTRWLRPAGELFSLNADLTA